MKFGKQILSQQFTEWSPYYLDYKGLKKFISSVLKTTSNDNSSNSLQSQKAAFFFKLERELEKINTFYLQKENELRVRLRSLVDKKKVLLSDISRLQHVSTLFKALQEALIQFEKELTKLQKYVELNNLGFQKILKKWDKRSKSSTKELYLSRQIDVQPCFNTQILTELSDMVAAQRIELSSVQDSIPHNPPSNNNTNNNSGSSGSEIDDAELELMKYVTSGQTAHLKQTLNRIVNSSAPDEHHGKLTRVFWNTCTDASNESLDALIETNLVDFKYTDDIMERSCLHLATMKGRTGLLKVCVEKGANVDGTDMYGRTALHYATMNGFTECVSFLLTRQTDIESRDHDSFSPLLYAIMNGHTACVEILLMRANAHIEPRFEGDHIPLSVACSFGHTEIVLMLYEKGAHNLPNAESLYPLHLVARQGHTELCRVLSRAAKEDIDRPDKYNTWTPLFWASNEGHADCVRILTEAGCRVNMKDENGKTALYYAAWEGHMACVQLLLDAGCEVESGVPEIFASSAPESPTISNDGIPTLSLPPPIIPFRIYGHSYLDRKCQVQVSLGSLRLYDNAHLSSLRLILSPKPDTGMIPHSVMLPLVDGSGVFRFLVDTLDEFNLEFDLLATFGSKVLGRGVALFAQRTFKIGEERSYVPLLNGKLHVIGELAFDYSVIKPFRGVQLEVGGRFDTYWKSAVVNNTPTSILNNASSRSSSTNNPTHAVMPPPNVPSFITASSLSGDYLRVVVQLTSDLVPVVFANWLIDFEGLTMAVSDLTWKQFSSIGECLLRDAVHGTGDSTCPITGNSATIQNVKSFLSLEHILKELPMSVGLHLELKYPSVDDLNMYEFTRIADRNAFIDAVLHCVYTHARTVSTSRSLFFSSYNSSICTAVNWKQPNYAIFFRTQNTSLKAAVKFAKQNNLLGIMYDAKTLVQIPALIKTTKESGLVLVATGEANTDPQGRQIQEKYGVDAMMVGHVVQFNTNSVGF